MAQRINDYIYGLVYNHDIVLASKGESVQSTRRKEGSIDEEKNFIVIVREVKNIYNEKADVGVLASNEHRAFPGSLLLANYHLMDNAPDVLSIDRAPIKYTTNLPGLTDEGSFTIIPDFGNYTSSLNQTLNTWFDTRSEMNSVNVIFQSDSTMAYSKEQLRVKFGTEFKYSEIEANIDLDAVHKQEKLITVHRFKQIFYTVSVQSPKSPAELFGSGATVEQLASKVNNDNPPVLVDSVSYGRVIYVKLETSSTDNEAKFILETKLAKLNTDIHTSQEYANQLKNLNMQVYVLGGATEQINLINAKTIQDINDVIVKYGRFDRNNIGYPMTYATQFLKDNSRAVIKSSTEYLETNRTVHKKGIIELSHTGWFVAQFKVEWEEIEYSDDGKKLRGPRKGWERNLTDLTAPFSTEIELTGNCENISVFAKECTGLFWEWWRTVIDRSGISLIDRRKFSIDGTTLSPGYSIEPPL